MGARILAVFRTHGCLFEGVQNAGMTVHRGVPHAFSGNLPMRSDYWSGKLSISTCKGTQSLEVNLEFRAAKRG